MPRPENKTDLLRIFGMAKHLGKFAPSMSMVTASLRELTRQDFDFVWCDNYEPSLKQLKQLLTSAPLLKYFDSKKQVEIQVTQLFFAREV